MRLAVNRLLLQQQLLSSVVLELDANHELASFRLLSDYQSEPAATEFVDGLVTYAFTSGDPMEWLRCQTEPNVMDFVAQYDNYVKAKTLWLWKGVDLSNLMLTDDVYITRL